MMSAKVIAFPPRTLEARIKAEAERRGIPYDDLLVELALKGWAKIQEQEQKDAEAVADHVLDYAEQDTLAALAILKRAARMILNPAHRTRPPEDAQ